MARYVAFLRAINVGGHTVRMTELKKLFEGMGFVDVETFIASGNVIFSTRAADDTVIARKIEKGLKTALGYEVRTMVRTVAEVAAIAQHAAFSEAEVKAAHSLYVGLFAEPLGKAALKNLAGLNNINDEFRCTGREVHFLSKIGMGESKFSNVKFEKQIGAPATFRNMNTMERLAKKYPAD